MDPVSRIFRKTEQGQSEVQRRSGALVARARMALILVNGSDELGTLCERLGPGAEALFDELLRLGLIEPMPLRPSRVPPSAAPAAAEPPVAAPVDVEVDAHPPPAAPTPDELAARLAPLRRELLRRLGEHYGPDAPVVARAALDAGDLAAYGAALEALRIKLSVYLGRKQTDRLLSGLLP